MPKYLPHGTQFSINAIPVGGLVTVSLPDRSKGEAEATDTDSGGDREFIPGLRDPGSIELTFKHVADDPGQMELESNYDIIGNEAIVECIITLPEEATTASGRRTYTFDGFVSTPPNGELALPDDETAELSATIRVTGPVGIA